MSVRIFHRISITAILSSSSSAVSLVRQSSPSQHASDDAVTCFRRRRARHCLNAWRNQSAENLYDYAAEEAIGQDGIELIADPRNFALADENTVGIKFLPVVESNAPQFRVVF